MIWCISAKYTFDKDSDDDLSGVTETDRFLKSYRIGVITLTSSKMVKQNWILQFCKENSLNVSRSSTDVCATQLLIQFFFFFHQHISLNDHPLFLPDENLLCVFQSDDSFVSMCPSQSVTVQFSACVSFCPNTQVHDVSWSSISMEDERKIEHDKEYSLSCVLNFLHIVIIRQTSLRPRQRGHARVNAFHQWHLAGRI